MSRSGMVELPVLQDAPAVPCCPPITAAELSAADAETTAAMFKALSDPVRLRLFSKIASHPGGEACVCDVQDVGVSQPTVSHHLKKLREAGLLTSQRRGTWVYYQVVPSAVAGMAALLGTHPPVDQAPAAADTRGAGKRTAASARPTAAPAS